MKALVLTVLTITSCAVRAEPTRDSRPPEDRITARVIAVSDGDTVVLDGITVGEVHQPTGGRKARLIGVDTPELYDEPECFGRQAREFTQRALDGASVIVEFDVEPTDRYGRALVYIWTQSGDLVNAALLKGGYAQQLTIPPNVRFAEHFTTLARDARASGRGLWSACAD